MRARDGQLIYGGQYLMTEFTPLLYTLPSKRTNAHGERRPRLVDMALVDKFLYYT